MRRLTGSGWLLLGLLAAPSLRASPAGDAAGRLVPGIPIAGELAPGEARAFVVELQAGEFLRIEVVQGVLDLEARLRGPGEGEPPSIDVSYAPSGREPASLLARASGVHHLDVRALPDQRTPSGRFTVETFGPARQATPEDRARLEAERLLAEGRREERRQTAESKQRSIALLDEAVSAWRALGDPYWEAVALGAAARVRQGVDPTQALALHAEALAVWRQRGDRDQEALTLQWMTSAHYERGSYAPMIELAEAALAHWKVVGSCPREGEVQGQVALGYDGLGQHRRSVEHYEAALVLARACGTRLNEAIALANMGTSLLYLGEIHRSMELFRQALAAMRAAGHRVGVAAALSNLGSVYRFLGEPRMALEHKREALVECREAGEVRCEAAVLQGVGQSHAELGEFDEALATYAQARALYGTLGNRQGAARVLGFEAIARSLAGQREAVAPLYAEALRASRENGDRWLEGFVLESLGADQARSGAAHAALESFQRLLELRRSASDRLGEASALYRLGAVSRDAGELEDARRRVAAAIEIGESTRARIASRALRTSYMAASTYYASLRDMYELQVDVLMGLHRREPGSGFDVAALEASERGRARSLLELVQEARVDPARDADETLAGEARAVREELSFKLERQMRLAGAPPDPAKLKALSADIDALVTRYEDLEARVRSASPRTARLVRPESLSASEIQRRVLDADTVLLEYALGEPRSYVWRVTPTSVSAHELPSRSRVESLAREAYEALGGGRRTRSDATAARALEALSRILLEPVAAGLGTRRVVVVADGALHYVPFAALPEPGGGGPLVNRHEIVTLPSASLLPVLREDLAGRKPPSKTLVVLADPVFEKDDERVRARPGGSTQPAAGPGHALAGALRDVTSDQALPRLVFSRREAQRILALVPPARRRGAFDFEASRATATHPDLRDYRYVHFATHGFLDSVRPELSGLVLSLVDRAGREQQGFLTTPEILALDLSADLVVLSACRTGLGREIRGEGLVGLTRAFMHAGAPRVVASLWAVDDEATADLMDRFYGFLLGKSRLRPAAALRRAQLDLARSRRWGAPFYWAGFQLQGDWN